MRISRSRSIRRRRRTRTSISVSNKAKVESIHKLNKNDLEYINKEQLQTPSIANSKLSSKPGFLIRDNQSVLTRLT